MSWHSVLHQVFLTVLFYLAVVGLFRFAGKRLAGQTTTFDLLILISLVVTIQQATLEDGRANKIIFIVTAYGLHLLVTRLCREHPRFRFWVRGKPTRLVSGGEVLHHNLRQEGLALDELKAGLRKLGIDEVSVIEAAYLEETGQISATRIHS